MNKYYGKDAPIESVVQADKDEWIELLGPAPTVETLRHLGITRRKWQDITRGKSPLVPVAAYRLAMFHRYGHLSDVLGSAWRDFFVLGDALVLPGVKQPLQAAALRSVWVELQELPRLRHKVARLMQECDYVEVSAAVSGWLDRLGRGPVVTPVLS
jgi:hypothetical protein